MHFCKQDRYNWVWLNFLSFIFNTHIWEKMVEQQPVSSWRKKLIKTWFDQFFFISVDGIGLPYVSAVRPFPVHYILGLFNFPNFILLSLLIRSLSFLFKLSLEICVFEYSWSRKQTKEPNIMRETFQFLFLYGRILWLNSLQMHFFTWTDNYIFRMRTNVWRVISEMGEYRRLAIRRL